MFYKPKLIFSERHPLHMLVKANSSWFIVFSFYSIYSIKGINILLDAYPNAHMLFI